MIDALEELLRKMRPYETEPGCADRAFNEALDLLMEGLRGKSLRSLKRGFTQAIDVMKKVLTTARTASRRCSSSVSTC